ncbi:TlpA family protein disulfide reductase [Sphingobacterium faecale]|uniref:Thioredoxin domain-containing protein n=1 Tax=Sphingobacterium faecale TaxID=2803775 RepID=A0ABS1R9W0_9SPHI|nr:thioredoxin-like domain-containing protein [Sphingobacterium faecale]MBL1411501.1 hypothetical protein [Sphingobacterium faecale]
MKILILYVLIQCWTVYLFGQGNAQLFVHAPVLAPDDTLVLYLQKERIAEPYRNHFRVLQKNNNNGVYSFSIDSLNNQHWVSMGLNFQKRGQTPFFTILDEFLLQPGDSVHIYLSPKKGSFRASEGGYDGDIPIVNESWDAKFSGRGASKYEALWKVKLLSEQDYNKKVMYTISSSYPTKLFDLHYKLQNEALDVLLNYKPTIESEIYDLFERQVRGQYGKNIGRQLEMSYYYRDNKGAVDSALRTEVRKYLDQGKVDLEHTDDNDILSPRYMDYLLKYLMTSFREQNNGEMDVSKCYYYIKNFIKPLKVRDRVIASFLLDWFQFSPNQEVLSDAMSLVKEPYSLEKVSKLKRLLKGEIGYSFSLPDVDENYHVADEYKGKVVFIDFWFASCLACHIYMRDVVEPIKDLYRDNPNVVFITISIDTYDVFKGMLNKQDFLPKGGVHLYTENKGYKHPMIEYYQITAYPYPLLYGKDYRLVNGEFNIRTLEGLKEGIEAALK